MCPSISVTHRGGSESFLDQDVSGTVVDVLEAVWAQQNTSIPARHNHHYIPHIKDLCWGGGGINDVVQRTKRQVILVCMHTLCVCLCV